MTIINLIGHFFASNLQFIAVDDNYIVTAINVLGKHRLTFAGKQSSHCSSQTSEWRFACINDIPLTGYISWLGAESLLAHFLAPVVDFLTVGFLVASGFLATLGAPVEAGFAAGLLAGFSLLAAFKSST